MSPGDQLFSVLIDSIGVLIGAIIDAVFGALVQPLLQAIASAFGIGV